MAALGFLSGLQSGMQSTMGLLDALEQRQRREQEAKQQQIIFDNKLEEYNYDKSVLRPLRENEARYRLQDLESSVNYNKEYRPLSLDILRGDKKWKENERNYILTEERPNARRINNLNYDIAKTNFDNAKDDRVYTLEKLRPQEERINNLNYQVSQYNFDTTKADNARKLAEQNLTRANQLYSAASGLVETNPQEAERLMGEADKLSGGLFMNAATGVNSRMYQQAREVMAGQRDMYDADFLETSRQYTKPTLINTGRADQYEFGGIESLPDGRVGYKLLPKFGGQYLESIKQAGERFGVDPRLVGAVIGAESAGNKSAVSPKGAQGLMQLMPETGREVAKRIGLDSFNPNNPEHNILVGTAYLGEQLKKYKGDVGLALAAYNAGPGAVDKHKGIPPFKETQAYVPKILQDYQRLVDGVPATKNRSSDLNDTIMADTPEQALGKIKRGVELEQGMNPRLKEMLLARQLATGSKPETGITGKDRYMAVDGRVFDVVSQQFVTDKSTEGEKLVKVGKDERLYNPATGEWVSPSGAGAVSALSSFTKQLGDDPETAKANLVDIQFPELGTEERAGVLSQLAEAQTPSDIFKTLKPLRIEQDAKAWASDLTQGLDPELVKSNPQAAAISQLSDRAKALGLAEGDIKELALEVLQLPGVANNPQAQIQLMAEKLKIAELERKAEERYQRKLSERNNLAQEFAPVGSPLSVFGE